MYCQWLDRWVFEGLSMVRQVVFGYFQWLDMFGYCQWLHRGVFGYCQWLDRWVFSTVNS